MDRIEAHMDRYLAISPCHVCYTLNSSPCRCGKYLYCDILCQASFTYWSSYGLPCVSNAFLHFTLLQMSDDHSCQRKSTSVPHSPRWLCHTCGEAFEYKLALKKHTATTHSKNSSYHIILEARKDILQDMDNKAE